MWATQLGLFGDGVVVGDAPAPPRRVYDHDAIMRERAAFIRGVVLDAFPVEADVLQIGEPVDAQDVALYWQRLWCRVVHGRTDSWCVLCTMRPCPVWDYLLDEARRVNAPHKGM